MDKKVLISIAVIVLIIAGVYLLIRNPNLKESTSSTEQTTQPSDIPVASAAVSETQVKEFSVTGSSFKFEPASLKVNKGDKVKITFKNSGGFHNFVIDEFNVKSKTISSGQEDTVEFVADKTGSFEYYCSVANHRAMGMKGTLTVQ